MTVIFDVPSALISRTIQITPIVFPEPESGGVAVEILLLSSIAEVKVI